MNLFNYGLEYEYIDTRISYDIRWKDYGHTWLSIFCGSKIITSLAIQNFELFADEFPLPYYTKRWEKCN